MQSFLLNYRNKKCVKNIINYSKHHDKNVFEVSKVLKSIF